MDFNKLDFILQNGTLEELDNFCSENNLMIKDGKIYHQNQKEIENAVKYWDKKQLVKKINLNS